MNKIKPNRLYECTANLTVMTKDIHRVPVEKRCELREGCVYHVNCDGLLQTSEGLAEITEIVARHLLPYKNDKDIKHLTELRQQIAVQIYPHFLASEYVAEIGKRAKRENRIIHEVIAECAIEHSESLVRILQETEEIWIQKLKYI